MTAKEEVFDYIQNNYADFVWTIIDDMYADGFITNINNFEIRLIRPRPGCYSISLFNKSDNIKYKDNDDEDALIEKLYYNVSKIYYGIGEERFFQGFLDTLKKKQLNPLNS